jgi:hypothetical protein
MVLSHTPKWTLPKEKQPDKTLRLVDPPLWRRQIYIAVKWPYILWFDSEEGRAESMKHHQKEISKSQHNLLEEVGN